MNDQELEKRLNELNASWRVPRDPPLDRMWDAIEAQVFAPDLPNRRWRWTRTLLPLAATLVLGFGLGRVVPSGGRGAGTNSRASSDAGAASLPAGTPVRLASQDDPFVGVATDYLERVTALLVTLAEEAGRGQPLEYSNRQARDLLATTRLLMDSPKANVGHFRQLLDDLELVLAQIARLPARPPAPDVYLIEQTLDQREVLPRLRVMLAENPTSQP